MAAGKNATMEKAKEPKTLWIFTDKPGAHLTDPFAVQADNRQDGAKLDNDVERIDGFHLVPCPEVVKGAGLVTIMNQAHKITDKNEMTG